MNCPNCKDQKLAVTHVFSAGENAETRNLRCFECGFKSTSVTFLVPRTQERRWGGGGYALAKRVRAGTVKNPVPSDE